MGIGHPDNDGPSLVYLPKSGRIGDPRGDSIPTKLYCHRIRAKLLRRDLIGMIFLHFRIEALEIFLTPLTSIRSPAFWSGMNPCILPIEIFCVLCWGIVFVNQPWRRFPCVYLLPNTVPISVTPLGKNENHRTPLVLQDKHPDSVRLVQCKTCMPCRKPLAHHRWPVRYPLRFRHT